MRCLRCGEELVSEREMEGGWHRACVREFFGTEELPEIEMTEKNLVQIAEQNTREGLMVPGVQKKISLNLSNENGKPRLTLVNYPTGYILKPQSEEFEALPEAEFLAMRMAEETGIKTVPFALIKVSKEGELAYITRRIDRVRGEDGKIEARAMEDFCQLDERLTEDKYKGSYERCAKIIGRYSETEGFDKSELFLRIVFSFVIGNSDMHLKNLSLIETEVGSGRYELSEAYDILLVNTVAEDEEEMALSLNRKKQKLKREDFLKYAEEIGLNLETAKRMMRKVCEKKERYFEMIDRAILGEEMKESLRRLVAERVGRLI